MDSLPLAVRYVDLLATVGRERGLIGPREAGRLWERHLINCALIAPGIPFQARLCDVGSGAGLPGLVLAICRPDLRVTLVEPLLRRSTFLSEAVGVLGLSNVEVRRDRAEQLHGRFSYDVVTSRAVAPLDRLVGWCLPLVRPGGSMLAMKGSGAAAEVEQAYDMIHKLGGRGVAVERFEADSTDAAGTPITALAVRVVRPDVDARGM